MRKWLGVLFIFSFSIQLNPAAYAGGLSEKKSLCFLNVGQLKNLPRLGSELSQFLNEYKEAIDRVLKIENASSEPASILLTDAMNYTLLAGGKRLRAILSLMLAKKYQIPEWAILPVIKGVEYFHAASLILDDLPAQDGAELRRGLPTNHLVYGEATAQLAAVALITEAFGEVSSLSQHFPSDLVLRIVAYWSEALGRKGITLGQLQDLTEGKADMDEITRSIHRKTGLAIEASLIPVAILANASDSEMRDIREFAFYLGILYQVKDDILDRLSSPEEIGKDSGADEQNNRDNFVSLLGLEKSEKMLWLARREALNSLDKIPGETQLLRELVEYLFERTR